MKFSSAVCTSAVTALSFAFSVKAEGDDDMEYEWAGIFPMADTEHVWSMQANDEGTYPDLSMKIVFFAVDEATEEALAGKKEMAETMITGDSCVVVADGGSFGPFVADGGCFELVVSTTGANDSTFTMDTTGVTNLATFAQHFPAEFERDQHYLMDSNGADVEPALVEGQKAYEWVGVFPLSDTSHVWNMQADESGSYPDQTMRLVIFDVDDADEHSIHETEDLGDEMIEATDCIAVADGGSIGPFTTEGACYELSVNTDAVDSSFNMDTTGNAAIVIYAQHVPVEFERTMHYLQDSAGEDIEATFEESTMGDHHHHHHDESGEALGMTCGCAMGVYDFNIDCSDQDAMQAALDYLSTNSCQTDCTANECEQNWLIVQSHHDYCDVDGLPSNVESDFHTYDSQCRSCSIDRDEVAGADMCPDAVCTDDSGNQAYAYLSENCASDCSSTDCIKQYYTLRVVHDSCDHNVLTTTSEQGLHTFEDICTDAKCNTPLSLTDQLTCETMAPTSSSSVVSLIFSAVGVVFGTVIMMA